MIRKTVRAMMHGLGLTNEAKFQKAIQLDRKANPSDYELADKVLEDFHSQGGLKHYTQAYKLVCLQRLLEKHQPETILELGTGSSSIIMASYAKKRNAKIVHVDESKKWLDNTKHNIHRYLGEDLKECEFVVAEKGYDLSKSPEHFWYELEIKECYDLLFLDGPALMVEDRNFRASICMDIFRIDEKLLPQRVVVDMRYPTVLEIQRKLINFYNPHISDVFKRQIRKQFDYYSVFERN